MTPIVLSGLFSERLDVAALVASIRRQDCGGVVVFEGRTRSPDGGRLVDRLEYEAHERLATQQLDTLAREAAERHGLGGVLVVHRIGAVPAGDVSVVIAAAAPHRGEAFDAVRTLIDRVKSEAAIWKKEFTSTGASWVGEATSTRE